jgi:hypothetical protein
MGKITQKYRIKKKGLRSKKLTPFFNFRTLLRVFIKNERYMKININHPSFISFLDNVTNSILSNITIENYFKLSQEKKMSVLYTVFKLMKKSLSVRTKLSDTEMIAFVTVLWKKNEESENYEFAAILHDIANNFEAVNEFTKTIKRQTRTVKTEKPNNG